MLERGGGDLENSDVPMTLVAARLADHANDRNAYIGLQVSVGERYVTNVTNTVATGSGHLPSYLISFPRSH